MQETPQPQQIPESYMESHAFRNAISEALIKQYKLPEASEKEWIDCNSKLYELWNELDKNVAYKEELFQLQQKFSDMGSLEFLEAYKELRARFSPELVQVEEKLRSLDPTSCNSCQCSRDEYQFLNSDQHRMKEQECAIVFKKYPNIGADSRELLKNSKYQREVQLATEKYNLTKNPEEYFKSLKDIQYKYIPEMKVLDDELKAIYQKYNNL